MCGDDMDRVLQPALSIAGDIDKQGRARRVGSLTSGGDL
jgi:hypothetical protein